MPNEYSKRVQLSKDDVRVIKERIRRALEYKKKHWFPMAKEAYEHYKGNKAEESVKKFALESKVNFVRPNTDIIYQSIGGGDIEWDVIAANKECADREDLNTAIINRIWKDIGADDEIIRPLQDSKIFSHGAVFIGWKVETIEEIVMHSREAVDIGRAESVANQILNKLGDIDASQESYQASETGDQATETEEGSQAQGVGEIDDIELSDSQRGKEVGEIGSDVLYDNIWLERIHPGDIVWDDKATSPILRDADWVARRITLSVTAAKKESRWNQDVINKCKGSIFSDKDEFKDLRNEDDNDTNTGGDAVTGSGRQVESDSVIDDEKEIIFWDYYEKTRMVNVVLADEVEDEEVMCDDMPYFFSGGGRVTVFPLEVLPDQIIPSIQYGESCAYMMGPFQREVTYDRTVKCEYKRRFLPQYWGTEDTFSSEPGADEEGIAAFNNPELARFVKCQKAPQPLVNPPIPGDFWLSDQQVSQDMAFVTGVNELRKGEFSSTRRTKFEVQEIARESSARSDFQMATYRKFLERVGYKIHRILADPDFGIPKRMVRVWNNQTQSYEFAEYDNTHCVGEWDYEVTAGPAIHRNREVDRQMTMEMIAELQPFAQTGQVDIAPLIEQLVKSYPIVKNAGDIVPAKNLPFNAATIAMIQQVVVHTLSALVQQGNVQSQQTNGNQIPVGAGVQ